MTFEYTRVSTNDQNPERQHIAIAEYAAANGIVIDRAYEDKASGRDFQRPQYQAMKATLRAGDVVIIKELDRMGRNMEQIKREWQELQQIGASIIVTDTPLLNTANKTDLEKQLITNIVFELLAYMAEKERQKIHARQAEGIAAAKAAGRHLGRARAARPEGWEEVLALWRGGSITAVQAMDRLGMRKTTFYKLVREEQQGAV